MQAHSSYNGELRILERVLMSQSADHIAEALRTGMRQLASGVCVITANDESRGTEQGRVAMTASSVTSLTDAPASLLVCINKDARLSSVLAQGDLFSVNVLAKEHEEVSTACAVPEVGNSRFSKGSWVVNPQSGLWHLEDAPVVFFCTLDQVHEYGTHKICIGKLSHVYFAEKHQSNESGNGEGTADLLTYVRGGYHILKSK